MRRDKKACQLICTRVFLHLCQCSAVYECKMTAAQYCVYNISIQYIIYYCIEWPVQHMSYRVDSQHSQQTGIVATNQSVIYRGIFSKTFVPGPNAQIIRFARLTCGTFDHCTVHLTRAQRRHFISLDYPSPHLISLDGEKGKIYPKGSLHGYFGLQLELF